MESKIMELKVVNPYNQETVCTLPYADDAKIAQAIGQAQGAFVPWSRLPIARRIEIVGEGLDRFRRLSENIARDVTLQMGKPIGQARSECKGTMDRAEYMVAIAVQTLSPDILPPKAGFRRRIEHVPLGVVFNVAAWNYPLFIPINVVVPALLAGNTVLLKHSAKTPLCGKYFEEALGDTGNSASGYELGARPRADRQRDRRSSRSICCFYRFGRGRSPASPSSSQSFHRRRTRVRRQRSGLCRRRRRPRFQR